jgi:hypothetical protein
MNILACLLYLSHKLYLNITHHLIYLLFLLYILNNFYSQHLSIFRAILILIYNYLHDFILIYQIFLL